MAERQCNSRLPTDMMMLHDFYTSLSKQMKLASAIHLSSNMSIFIRHWKYLTKHPLNLLVSHRLGR